MRVGSVWHYQFKANGKVHHGSTGLSTRAEAAVWLRAYRDEVSRKTPAGEVTLAEVVELWAEAHTGSRTESHVRTVRVMAKHFGSMLGRPVRDVTTERVEAAVAAYLAPGRSRHGANALLRTLKLLLTWAQRRGMLSAIPFNVRQSRAKRVPRQVVPPHSIPGLVGAAMRKHGPQHGLAVALMVGAGLREGEALGARWEWLDLAARTFTPGNTKGGEAVALPLPTWLVALLSPAPPEGLILPGAGGRPHAQGFTRAAVAAAGEAVGVPGLTPHRLRATFATVHAQAGTPIQVIQRLLRHESISTTASYLEATAEMARAATERMEALVAGR